MNQARKDTTGIKLEVNERLVLFGVSVKRYQCFTFESGLVIEVLSE